MAAEEALDWYSASDSRAKRSTLSPGGPRLHRHRAQRRNPTIFRGL